MLEVKVWGDFACFTRPEHKVERVSYDVMTPSAARGILEAIAWKPEFRWRIKEIWVLNPVRHFSLVRNEVKTQASARAARGWEDSSGGLFADQDRTQRFALLLRDVAYRIRADIELLPHATDPVAKYRDIFRRRVEKGQAHAQPYLGTREFSAFFAPPEDTDTPQDLTDDLGRMLFDIEFTPEEKGPVRYREHGAEGGRWREGRATPRFFPARLERGVLHIPQELYESSR
ncbi:MAG: type I-C CRISPR-associated protein Cas5c [Trueperaceae bacterium]